VRSSIVGLICRRCLTLPPVLLGISMLTFFVINVLPGDAAQQLLGAEATPEQVAQLKAELNLDRGAVARYGEWLGSLARGDFGNSLASGQPVSAVLRERLPVTLQLAFFAFCLSVGLAVPLGLIAARWPNGLVDWISAVVTMSLLSIPNYVVALGLVFVFSVHLNVFPSIGFIPASVDLFRNIQSLTLPALAIALPFVGFYARFLRGDLLEQVHRQEYVVTAMAKGIGPWRVLIRHAFRNSVFGLLAIVGLNIGVLVGGTVIIEQIYALPGLGQALLQAINVRDVAVVQAIALVMAVVTVTATLVVDLLYTALDPRIRYGRTPNV
jgi:peptide/nickel transport system permease protein